MVEEAASAAYTYGLFYPSDPIMNQNIGFYQKKLPGQKLLPRKVVYWIYLSTIVIVFQVIAFISFFPTLTFYKYINLKLFQIYTSVKLTLIFHFKFGHYLLK